MSEPYPPPTGRSEYPPPGSYPPQGVYSQGGQSQGDYSQGGYPQGGGNAQGSYQQGGGYPQSGYPQSSYQQGGYPQGGQPQGGYPQGGQPQGYPQGGGYPPPQGGYGVPGGYQPGGYQQGGYPPGAQGGGGTTGIVVNTKFMPLAWIFYFVKPKIGIDDQPPMQAAWGYNTFPVVPGRHKVHVHTPYFLPSRVGPADFILDVAPGQTVELEYRTPLIVFLQGSLGPPPQKYNGTWIMWVLLGIFILAIICCCASSLLNNSH